MEDGRLTNIIVVFPKMDDAKTIRNILVKNGFPVTAVCTTGALALQYADELSDGIVICGYRFSDMIYTQLHNNLPVHFEMLLVASNRYLTECRDNDIVCVTLPIKMRDLVDTVGMMVQNCERKKRKRKQQPKLRNEKDRAVINHAKKLLMERNNMTEDEAHRYIQKCSMDSGTNLVETAQMVLTLMI